MNEEFARNFGLFINILTYLASGVMAVSAALQSVRFNLDPFGSTVVAFATALGGGTLRDLLLGSTPVFWIEDLGFLVTIVPVALVTHFLAVRMPSGTGVRRKLLQQFDAIGLALFTLIGVKVAVLAEVHGIAAVVIGCITGTVGGMIRDILCNVTPGVLREDYYATIGISGGACYLCLGRVVEEMEAGLISFILMLIARLAIIQMHGSRPKW